MALGCLTAATVPPTHTLTQMPNNLTLVVATPKRLGALPVVIIINRLALKEFIGETTQSHSNNLSHTGTPG